MERLIQAEALRADSTPGTAPSDGIRRDPLTMTAAAAVAAVPDDRTALLEYLTGPDGAPTIVFVVTRGGVQSRVLPPADSIAPFIERFGALMEDGHDPVDPLRLSGPPCWIRPWPRCRPRWTIC